MRETTKVKATSRLKLIYASGTYSHKEDFLLIEHLLFQFLYEHTNCQLSILGAAQVSERILALPNVSNYPVLEYKAMLEFISRHDLMLVPLVDNIFNQAKSNVKFIESGSVGVPVLASAVGEFNSTIDHGRNGFLANTPADWLETLENLVVNPDRIDHAGHHAKTLVNKSFTTSTFEIDISFLKSKASNKSRPLN
ncbi:glycosyltransferase family 4 protein [Pseudomonas syringae pv. actinidiae]|nr:glycosyltransferase family 4 protein [Pseudomonas syringae pv. actinidiae]